VGPRSIGEGRGGSAVPSTSSYRYACKIKPPQWEVVKGELETNGIYRVCGSRHIWAKRIKKSEQPTASVTNLFLVPLQSAVL